MPKPPSEPQVRHLFAQLRRHARNIDQRTDPNDRREGRTPRTLPGNEERALRLTTRAANMDRNARDGYPTSVGADTTHSTSSGLTSVEAAANANIDGHGAHDPVHDLTIAVYAALRQIDLAFEGLDAALNRADRLTADPGDIDIICCEAHQAAGHQVAVNISATDHNGRLARLWRLCDPCRQYGYKTIERARARGVDPATLTADDLIPTPDQVRRHDQTGRWTYRVTDSRKVS